MNGVDMTPTTTRPPAKPSSTSRRREGGVFGVEVVAPLEQSRRGRGVEVGAECDDQDVGVECAGIGLDPPGVGVDGGHGRLHERTPGLTMSR